MPDLKALDEIVTNCTWEYVIYKKQLGYVITGKNGNNMFLPLTNGSVKGKDYAGKYWCNISDEADKAYMLVFDHSSRNTEKAGILEYLAVRGVLKQ